MKTNLLQHKAHLDRWLKAGCLASLLWVAANFARASIAYGTINNFDTVNDTSNVCHGFEIELDDFGKALEAPTRQQIVDSIKRLGYRYVVLDLAGYRTGSTA